MILDARWCCGLQKGDIITETNRQNVQTPIHAQVVDILKYLPVESEVNVMMLQGGKALSFYIQYSYTLYCADHMSQMAFDHPLPLYLPFSV